MGARHKIDYAAIANRLCLRIIPFYVELGRWNGVTLRKLKVMKSLSEQCRMAEWIEDSVCIIGTSQSVQQSGGRADCTRVLVASAIGPQTYQLYVLTCTEVSRLRIGCLPPAIKCGQHEVCKKRSVDSLVIRRFADG